MTEAEAKTGLCLGKGEELLQREGRYREMPGQKEEAVAVKLRI